MAYLTAFAVLFLCAFAFFLGQLAVHAIKIEKKINGLLEILEEEIVDVFGTSAPKKEEPAPPAAPGKAETPTKAAAAAQGKPAKAPAKA